jgi:16S rRNA (uracil1498-N3)-methyltransferase
MRRRFFIERFEANSVTIRGETAEHIGRVLRAKQGQLYELSDGEQVWLGCIERVALSKRGDNRVEFALVERVAARPTSLAIQLLISLIKFDRFEWCLEKATELGVAEIVPLAAARTDKALLGAAEKRKKRWEKILLESAQQARRLRPPAISGVLRSDAAFRQARAECKIMLSERPEAPALREALAVAADAKAFALCVGPEGGWVEEEFATGRAAGFSEASLGENILRTETAVIGALAVLHFAAGK